LEKAWGATSGLDLPLLLREIVLNGVFFPLYVVHPFVRAHSIVTNSFPVFSSVFSLYYDGLMFFIVMEEKNYMDIGWYV